MIALDPWDLIQIWMMWYRWCSFPTSQAMSRSGRGLQVSQDLSPTQAYTVYYTLIPQWGILMSISKEVFSINVSLVVSNWFWDNCEIILVCFTSPLILARWPATSENWNRRSRFAGESSAQFNIFQDIFASVLLTCFMVIHTKPSLNRHEWPTDILCLLNFRYFSYSISRQ